MGAATYHDDRSAPDFARFPNDPFPMGDSPPQAKVVFIEAGKIKTYTEPPAPDAAAPAPGGWMIRGFEAPSGLIVTRGFNMEGDGGPQYDPIPDYEAQEAEDRRRLRQAICVGIPIAFALWVMVLEALIFIFHATGRH